MLRIVRILPPSGALHFPIVPLAHCCSKVASSPVLLDERKVYIPDANPNPFGKIEADNVRREQDVSPFLEHQDDVQRNFDVANLFSLKLNSR
jgi:hypothetical protein